MFLAAPADWSMRCLQSQLGPANTSTFQSSASGTRSRNSGCSMRVEAFAGINISGRLDHPLGMSADRNAVANDGSPAYGCDKTCVVYGTADTAARKSALLCRSLTTVTVAATAGSLSKTASLSLTVQ
jgi:hypothetical protein